jgi:hypothetical protein
MIFKENILDDFEFEEYYLPIRSQNAEQISQLNFSDIKADLLEQIKTF